LKLALIIFDAAPRLPNTNHYLPSTSTAALSDETLNPHAYPAPDGLFLKTAARLPADLGPQYDALFSMV
jgi:hypothetical protein